MFFQKEKHAWHVPCIVEFNKKIRKSFPNIFLEAQVGNKYLTCSGKKSVYVVNDVFSLVQLLSRLFFSLNLSISFFDSKSLEVESALE